MKKYIFDSTKDENGNFVTGYRMSEGRKYITIEYLTNWQGDRDKTYRIEKATFTTPEAAINSIQAEWVRPYRLGNCIK